MDEITAELVQEAIEGDERFALINLGIAIENEISQSESLKIIFKESFTEAVEALRALTTEPPQNYDEIRSYQNVIHRAAAMRKWLLDRVRRAAQIEQTLHDEEADESEPGA